MITTIVATRKTMTKTYFQIKTKQSIDTRILI
jgi:hypothetical protein